MRKNVKLSNKPAGQSKYALKVKRRRLLAQKLNQSPNTPFPILNSCLEIDENYKYVMDSVDLVEEDAPIFCYLSG